MIENELQECSKGNVFYDMFVMYVGVNRNEDYRMGANNIPQNSKKSGKGN